MKLALTLWLAALLLLFLVAAWLLAHDPWTFYVLGGGR